MRLFKWYVFGSFLAFIFMVSCTVSVPKTTTPNSPDVPEYDASREIVDLHTVTSDSSVIFTWTNPSSTDFDSVYIRRSTLSIETVTQGVQVYSGVGTNYLDSVPSGVYYYRFFSKNSDGSFYKSVQVVVEK